MILSTDPIKNYDIAGKILIRRLSGLKVIPSFC